MCVCERERQRGREGEGETAHCCPARKHAHVSVDPEEEHGLNHVAFEGNGTCSRPHPRPRFCSAHSMVSTTRTQYRLCCRVPGLGIGAKGLRPRVYGVGFRVQRRSRLRYTKLHHRVLRALVPLASAYSRRVILKAISISHMLTKLMAHRRTQINIGVSNALSITGVLKSTGAVLHSPLRLHVLPPSRLSSCA